MLNWFRRKKHQTDGKWFSYISAPKTNTKIPGKDQCSFCCKNLSEVEKSFAGPNDVHICNKCLDRGTKAYADYKENFPEEPFDSSLTCSFCLKNGNEVRYLAAGPDVYICGDCIGRFRQP